MKISKKIHPMVLASVILTSFLILISSTASAATYAYIKNYKSYSQYFAKNPFLMFFHH